MRERVWDSTDQPPVPFSWDSRFLNPQKSGTPSGSCKQRWGEQAGASGFRAGFGASGLRAGLEANGMVAGSTLRPQAWTKSVLDPPEVWHPVCLAANSVAVFGFRVWWEFKHWKDLLNLKSLSIIQQQRESQTLSRTIVAERVWDSTEQPPVPFSPAFPGEILEILDKSGRDCRLMPSSRRPWRIIPSIQ